MARIDHTYHNLLEKILQEGYDYKDESRDVMCKQISSYEFRHNIRLNGFPAITTKKLYWKGVVGELIWFLRGDTNIKYLVDNNVHIWDKDAYNWYLKNKHKTENPYDFESWLKSDKDNDGIINKDLGRVYGAQWRNFRGFTKHSISGTKLFSQKGTHLDQISDLIQNLKDKPMSRRHIVTAWNPTELDNMALPPCHWSFEILPRPLFNSEYTKQKMLKNNIPIYEFDLKWHQRSVDTFLGLPFNIASYGLLMEIIGKMTNMIPNELIGDLSNVHIYHSHIEAVKTQLKNQPDKYWKPIQLDIDVLTQVQLEKGLKHIDNKDIEIGSFKLKDYESYPTITAEMLSPKV